MQIEGPKNAHANSDTQAEINSYDAVVIGSGYGGSVAALRLAEAGLKVCLLEKGRQWEAHQFPTSAWQTLRTTRWHTPLGVFGSSDSLYQIHYQGAVIAFVAAGLGGGSLINGGVVLPTPARAKRDPRWPLEWSGAAWDNAQSRARSMLQAESVPTQCSFYQDRVLKAVANEIEDSVPDRVELSIKLSRDSNGESSSSNDACKACGNCFTGCPYNAKKSVDKSYIGAAVKAGCTILTQCEARFVLPNFNHTFTSEEREEHSWQRHRRWRIYLDEINFITADFVVMAAGVLGTTNLLLQSKIRGLPLSDKIGHGFSCNGNSVAFVCGTHVTTKGHSLISSQLKDTPAFDRPGPSITTSYTSSLGYTIQGAILANGFSFVFFKCISHRGFWFGLIYGLWHKIKRLMKNRNSDSLIFNMMGHDAADGRVEFDLDRGLAKFFPPTDPLITKKISTVERIVKRIGGQMFMPTLRNTTVHLLGGCSVGPSYKDSVANPNGQVFRTCGYFHSKCSSSASANKQERDDDSETCETHIHNGLYVCDASLIPCAVGVNPSFTITTVAEHVAQAIVKDAASYYTQKGESVLVDEHASTVMSPSDFLYGNTILNGNSMRESFDKAGARVWETLVGNIEGLPCTLEIVMDMGSSDISQDILRGRVGGKLRMQALESGLLHIVDGTVDMCVSSTRSPFSQYMLYRLLLVAETESMYEMKGKKEMKPFLLGSTAWTESRTLELELNLVKEKQSKGRETPQQNSGKAMRGVVRVSYIQLLKSAITMRGPRKLYFGFSLLRSLFRTYFIPRPRLSPFILLDSADSPHYPPHTIHEMYTDDGARISCWRWLPSANVNMTDGKNSKLPECVLLLNGYSGESYFLPTEDNDLVRTLLNEGYEVWILRMRLHFSVCTTNPFSLDDIARFDLPAAFLGIQAIRSKKTPIHVVAHCIGGLTIHMALLGGYVSVSSVASLTCMNSSMFFDVTKLAMVKLFVPLIPISLAVLGKNNVLCFSDYPSESWRHRLLKMASAFIPRVEHCTCKECNIFSGIFGNAFWHENVTEILHAWLSKETLVRLPTSGFRQLRRICMEGNVLSSTGENIYMPYVGRLSLPTTYISGGRSLLVTPTTTERAHALMQHHHPEFHHSRHVVPGYGHSDLLIGEKAPEEVFPLILDGISKSSHIETESSLLDAQATEVKRHTWVVPPSKSASFLRVLRVCTFAAILCIIFCLV